MISKNKYYVTTRKIPTYIKYLIAKKGEQTVHEVTSTTGNFYTDMVAPLKKLLVSFEPIQSGSGTPSPTNVRPIEGRTELIVRHSGVNVWDEEYIVNWAKNLLSISEKNQTVNGITFTQNANGTIVANGTATKAITYNITPSDTTYSKLTEIWDVKPNVQYVLSSGVTGSSVPCRMQLLVNGIGIQPEVYTGFSSPFSFTAETIETAMYRLVIRVSRGQTLNNVVFKPMICLATETDSDFEPYVGKVYGGTVDVVSGLLTVDRKYLTVSDFSLWGGDSISAGGLHWVNVPKTYPTALAGNGNICSHAEYFDEGNGWLSTIPAYSTAGSFPARIYVQSNSFADFQTEYANLQAVYMLAEPYTIQLKLQQINTLKGNNTVTVEGGDLVELVYLTHTL